MKAFYTILIFLIPFFGFSQGWVKSYENFNGTIDVGLKVSKTGENGYVLSGFSDANSGKLNILIIKTDIYGNEQWSKIIDAGEGEDDVSFDNLYSDELIYVVGVINEGVNTYDEELGTSILGVRHFIKVYNLNGELVNEKQFFPTNNFSSLGLSKLIELNCGLDGSGFENNWSGPKFYAFDNYINHEGTYIYKNVVKINKSNLDSIQSFEIPPNPSSSSNKRKIIDIEYGSYINYVEFKGNYHSSDIYYLQNTNNDDQSDIYITSSSSQYCDLNNNNFYQQYGGFEDDFAYDFVLTNNNSDMTSAIVVGSTKSYGNSSNNCSSAYIFKTQLFGSNISSNLNNNIDWELVIGDGEIWEVGRNITKLDNGNFIVIIENYASLADNDSFKYKLIEIDINGNIICENGLDFNGMLNYNSPFNINAAIQINDIINDDDGYAIVLGHHNINSFTSLYVNNWSLPESNGGDDTNIFLAKVKCGETISEIKNIDNNYSKNSKGIFNLLGQKNHNYYNSILFEIFDDGSVEKKVIIK